MERDSVTLDKFQVVVANKQDFIIDYRSFKLDAMDAMLTYVREQIEIHGTTIKITQWNKDGERL